MNIPILAMVIRNLLKFEKGRLLHSIKNACLSDEEMERKKKKLIKNFNFENGEKLSKIYMKSDVILLICVFWKDRKVSTNEFDITPFFCVHIPGFSWLCGLKHTDT